MQHAEGARQGENDSIYSSAVRLRSYEELNIHLHQIADNFKTDLDQLSLSRKGIELTGEEKAEDFEGEVVVVRPRMA